MNPSMAMVIGGPSMDSGSSSSSSSPSGGGASAAPAQQVRIWSDKNANRLIVSAPKSKLPEVERLVGILDTNKPEDVAVRVLPLKRVAAVDVVKEIGDLYKTLSGRSLKEVIQITADDQSNSLIILSSEANFHNIERLMAAMDTEDAQEKIMKTFILKNADATDVAKQLQDLNTDQSSSSRYNIILYNPYGSSGGGGKSKKMTVVADRRRNAVIVQSPPAQMDAIEKMISELDQTVDDESLAPKVYQLRYVSASDIEDVLNELFLKKTQQRNYWDYNSDSYSSERTDQDAGRLYGKVRITSEPYSNTIIVTSNSKENLDVVENVLKQLDQPAEGGESTLRVGLRFAKSEILARSLNILFARNGSPGFNAGRQQQQGQGATGGQQGGGGTQQQSANAYQGNFDLGQETIEEGYYSWLGGAGDNAAGRSTDGRSTSIRPVSDLVGRVRVVPDRRGNGLLISANAHLFPQILKLVNELDAPADQVMIEARLLEVSTDFLDKLGVRWSPDGNKVFTADDFDNSIIAHVTADYQHGFGPLTTVNQPLSPSTVAQSLVALRSGVLSSTINMDFLVQFLKKTTDATVLAEPQINVRDNETGRLFVGQQVPVPDNNSAYQGTQNTTFKYKNVGVVLEVTPHINNAGDVELKVHAEASTTVPGVTVLGGAVFDTRAFLTDLRAKDGETLILGGIIQKQVSDTLRKTPFFGDIPGLGWAFKKKDKTTHTVELMVFLRPRVVRNSEDARELMRETEQKAPLIKKWDDDSAPQPKDQGDKKKK
jgi:type II secretion system protein D